MFGGPSGAMDTSTAVTTSPTPSGTLSPPDSVAGPSAVVIRGSDAASQIPVLVKHESEKVVIPTPNVVPSSTPSPDNLPPIETKLEELEKKLIALEGELAARDAKIKQLEQQNRQMTVNKPVITPMPVPNLVIPGVESRQIGRSVRIAIPDSALFQPGSTYIIQASGEETLRKVVGELQINYPNHLIRVEGHSDSMSLDPQNPTQQLELSTYKASIVAKYLAASMRIDPTRLEMVGRGAAEPLADNATEDGRARNRRIELVVNEE